MYRLDPEEERLEGLEDVCLEAHRLEMEHLDDIHHDIQGSYIEVNMFELNA